MRVLAITPYFAPDVSGAATYLGGVLSGLVDEGAEVTVLHQSHDAHPTKGRIEVHCVSHPVRGMTSAATARRAIVLHRKHPFDLVVAGTAHPAGLIAVGVGAVISRPVVVLALGEDLAPAERSRLTRCLQRMTLRRADHVMAASSDTLRRVHAVAGRQVGASLLWPAVDARPFLVDDRQAASAVRLRLGLDTRRVVLTTARLEARKGHDVALCAITGLGQGFEDVSYLVVGRGDPSPLHELAHRVGMADRLVIVGNVTDDQLPSYYGAADVFAMVSRPGPMGEVDGFGIVYLEAAASGLPVVAGNLGGCRDAVIDGTTAFCVDPADEQAVGSAIRRLLDDPPLAAAMGAAGRARVQADFDVRQMRKAAAKRLTAVARRGHVPGAMRPAAG